MATQTKLWYLENINLFKGMSMKDMKEVERRTTMKIAEKDQYIYFPEDPSTSVYFLKEGKVKIGSYSDSGRENIKAILESAGGTLEHSVRMTLYIRNLEDFSQINDVYAEFFPQNKPARTTIEVAKLPKDAAICMDAIAHLGP